MIKSIAELPKVPLNAVAAHTLFALVQLKDEGVRGVCEVSKNDFLFKVFGASCPPDFEICKRVQLFVCSELVQNPAEVVMYVHALFADARKRGMLTRTYTLEHFCFLFAAGVPTHDELAKAWDAQKCVRGEGSATDNLIDNFDNW